MYVTDDYKTITNLHSGKYFDPKAYPKMEYRELVLEDGEYIERVNCIKSVQTGFIRSITIGTNYQRNMCVEGQIEVHDISQTGHEKRRGLEITTATDFCPSQNNTFIEGEGRASSALIKTPSNPQKFERDNFKSIDLSVMDDVSYDMDVLNVRKQSISEPQTKIHSCNLKLINHVLIGIRTSFSGEYLEDLELYTELNEDIKINLVSQSKSAQDFIFT